MKDSVLVRTIDDAADCARVRGLLVDALGVLDRSSLPDAVTVATLVSHALEVLSPGTDSFQLTETDAPLP